MMVEGLYVTCTFFKLIAGGPLTVTDANLYLGRLLPE